jgi:hypothetical protein
VAMVGDRHRETTSWCARAACGASPACSSAPASSWTPTSRRARRITDGGLGRRPATGCCRWKRVRRTRHAAPAVRGHSRSEYEREGRGARVFGQERAGGGGNYDSSRCGRCRCSWVAGTWRAAPALVARVASAQPRVGTVRVVSLDPSEPMLRARRRAPRRAAASPTGSIRPGSSRSSCRSPTGTFDAVHVSRTCCATVDDRRRPFAELVARPSPGARHDGCLEILVHVDRRGRTRREMVGLHALRDAADRRRRLARVAGTPVRASSAPRSARFLTGGTRSPSRVRWWQAGSWIRRADRAHPV